MKLVKSGYGISSDWGIDLLNKTIHRDCNMYIECDKCSYALNYNGVISNKDRLYNELVMPGYIIREKLIPTLEDLI